MSKGASRSRASANKHEWKITNELDWCREYERAQMNIDEYILSLLSICLSKKKKWRNIRLSSGRHRFDSWITL